MKVLKFGGTSVGSSQKIRRLKEIINDGETKIVVLSAMSGTTDSLENICSKLANNEKDVAGKLIEQLLEEYIFTVNQLFSSDIYTDKGLDFVKSRFEYIRTVSAKIFNDKTEKIILAQGEILSTHLLYYCLEECGISSYLISALDFMRVDKDGEPDHYYIKSNLKKEIKQTNTDIYITQGYICRDAYGEISNLKRGGSDYTAALIGASVNASEIQIWTDIDGFHNNDPRYVSNTFPIRNLSFCEAAELAYFGAKILHPSSILPAKNKNIPVRLKNTLNPTDRGTLITERSDNNSIIAVAAKDGITAITVKSTHMLLSYGFLRKVFEIFEAWKTPIDMIATSEVAISLTVDNTSYLDKIVDNLKKYGNVNVDHNKSIVCIVGNFTAEKRGLTAKVLDCLKEIPIRMISYGGSEHNMTVLTDTSQKVKALNLLNNELFNI